MRALMQQMGQGGFPGMPGMFGGMGSPQHLEILLRNLVGAATVAQPLTEKKKEKKEERLRDALKVSASLKPESVKLESVKW